jgi:hypothetical protein
MQSFFYVDYIVVLNYWNQVIINYWNQVIVNYWNQGH